MKVEEVNVASVKLPEDCNNLNTFKFYYDYLRTKPKYA